MEWLNKLLGRPSEPKEPDEAADLKRELALWQAIHGPESPLAAPSMDNLAEVYKIHGQYAKTEPLYKRALATREKALDPDHPKVVMIIEKMAKLYRKMGREDEAEQLERRALATRAATASHSGSGKAS